MSAPAIETANRETSSEGLSDRISFQVGDASELPFKPKEFTHVLAGSTFGFILSREKALAECARVLTQEGRLCIGNFYYDKPPPADLLAQVSRTVGFSPSSDWNYNWWNSFFSLNFVLETEINDELPVLSQEAIEESVRSFIYDYSVPLRQESEKIKQAAFERLLADRRVLNEHRNYQRLNVSIWKKK
jgi:SAM-dependent methyltransferase